MNKGCKVVLIGCGVLVLLMAVGAAVAVAKLRGAYRGAVASGALKLAELPAFTAPPGYRAEPPVDPVGLGLMKLAVVQKEGDKDGMAMVFFAMMGLKGDPATEAAAMQQGLQQAMATSPTGASAQLQVTKQYQREITIAGAKQQLEVKEGKDKQGRDARVATCVFPGKSGAIMLMAMATQDKWDSKGLHALTDSVK